jgi:hypothetical protein
MSRLEEPEECVDGVVLVGHVDVVESPCWQVYVIRVTSNAWRYLSDITLKNSQQIDDWTFHPS